MRSIDDNYNIFSRLLRKFSNLRISSPLCNKRDMNVTWPELAPQHEHKHKLEIEIEIEPLPIP
jgi:hypothetical protein